MTHKVALELQERSGDRTMWHARCLNDRGVRGQVCGGPNDKVPPQDKLATLLVDMGEFCGGVSHEIEE